MQQKIHITILSAKNVLAVFFKFIIKICVHLKVKDLNYKPCNVS